MLEQVDLSCRIDKSEYKHALLEAQLQLRELAFRMYRQQRSAVIVYEGKELAPADAMQLQVRPQTQAEKALEPTMELIVEKDEVYVGEMLPLQVLFGLSTKSENDKKSNSLATIEMLKIREDQTIQLDSYRWIDEPNGVAAIPIDRAMDLVIEELAEAREK